MTAEFGNATIKDVAQLSGVSSMTVSRVINRSERVSPEKRQRVEQAIAELGYVPSRLARGLIRQKTGTLAVIVPDVANPFFTLTVRGAEDVARRADFRVILCDTRADLTIERDVIEGMSRLLELDERPTAVFTVNNLVALGAIEAVRAKGLRVPEDMALVCFDDIEYASRLYPFLTVMAQPAETFGTLGTQLLLDRVA